MILHLNIKSHDKDLVKNYIGDVLKSLYGMVDLELFDQLQETVIQYNESLTKITISTFDQSDMIRSVRLGNIAFAFKKTRTKFSELQAYDRLNHDGHTYTDLGSLGVSHSFFNANIYGPLKDEESGYLQVKMFLLNNLNERLNAKIQSCEYKLKILKALFLDDEFEGQANPIVFTLAEIKLAQEKFVFEILKSTILDENVFELACHGVSSSFVKNTDDVNPFEVILNYIKITQKYELINTNDKSHRYISALNDWVKDNKNKFIFLRDFSKNNFDCLDQNYFALEDIVLKCSYNPKNLNNLLQKQIFSDSGIWRTFLKSDPVHISKTLKFLASNEFDEQSYFNENLHFKAFLFQFLLKKTLPRFDVVQLNYLISKAKFKPFMLYIVTHLNPTEYAKANHLFGVMMNMMWIVRGYHYTKAKSLEERFDRSEFTNVLDYVSDMNHINFNQRFTEKSLLRYTEEWHNSTEQRKKRVFEFEYPAINYDVLFVRFEAIRNSAELRNEIDTMHHCISSYSDLMAKQKYIAFRFIDTQNDTRGTVGVHFSSYINANDIHDSYHLYKFDQINGPSNTQLPSYARNACESLIARLMNDQPLAHLIIEKHTAKLADHE